MLSYQENRELENLLESLFADDSGSTLEDVEILGWPGLLRPFVSCCTYSYSSYG